MKQRQKSHALILRFLVPALIIAFLLSVCCAAGDQSQTEPDGKSAVSGSETDMFFPQELPPDCSSWKEYRIKHTMKPEHAILLRTLLPRMLHKLPEEPEDSAESASESASETGDVSQENLQYLDSFIATAYYLTGYTSTGAYTTVNHTLAVNPNIIPYGTHVWIWLEDGTYVGDFYAEDTGSNMMAHPYVIDIYMGNDYDACVQWGARRVLVYTE